MIHPFEQFLINKGWKRYKSFGTHRVEDYTDSFTSTMGPLGYFTTDGINEVYYSLTESNMPPYMRIPKTLLKIDKNSLDTNGRASQLLFINWKENMYNTILEVIKDSTRFIIVDATDTNNIKIEIRGIS